MHFLFRYSIRRNNKPAGRCATLLVLTALGCFLQLPAVAETLTELGTAELQRAPHKYWAQGILFRDVLEKGPYGRDVSIGENKYVRVKGHELGVFYIPVNLRQAFDLLQLGNSYLFQGTVLNYKRDFVIVAQSMTGSIEKSPKVMEMIKTVGTPITSASQESENPAYQNFNKLLKNSQNALFTEADKMGVDMEDLFKPDADGKIPAPELVQGAIRRIERDQETTAFDILRNLVTAALYDEVLRRKQPAPVDSNSSEQIEALPETPAVQEKVPDADKLPENIITNQVLEPVATQEVSPMKAPVVISPEASEAEPASEPGFWERRRIHKAEKAAEKARQKELEAQKRQLREAQEAAERQEREKLEAAEKLQREQQKVEQEQIERAEKQRKAEEKAAAAEQKATERAEKKRLKDEEAARRKAAKVAEDERKATERAEQERQQAEEKARLKAEEEARDMAVEQEEPTPAPATSSLAPVEMQEDQLTALRSARNQLKKALDSGDQKEIQAAADQLRKAVAAARAATASPSPEAKPAKPAPDQAVGW